MQHILKWLENGKKERPRSKQPPNSSITKHLINCTAFNPPGAQHFKILHSGEHLCLNKILEALEIKFRNPELCIQKEYVYELKIPWQ